MKILELVGVGYSDGGRVETFKLVHEGDRIVLGFDHINKYDPNAIGAYTVDKRLIGYVPRDHKRLIAVVKSQGGISATIVSKVTDPKGRNHSIKVSVEI